MALIKCKECGKEHSNDAKRCPHCGYYRGGHEFNKGMLIVAGIIILMFIIMLIVLKDVRFSV